MAITAKIKHLTLKPEKNKNFAKYPLKIGGVNNSVDNFHIYPQKYCGETQKNYIFDDLLNYN